jgi:quinol monooxygenase YgiN
MIPADNRPNAKQMRLDTLVAPAVASELLGVVSPACDPFARPFHSPPGRAGPIMVLLRTRLRVDPAHRAKVVRSLSRILGPLRASAGCVNCHLYADVEDDNALLFAQEWSDEEHLIEHLRSDSARVLLSALDCAAGPPEVRLDTVVDGEGIEFIARCLDGE